MLTVALRLLLCAVVLVLTTARGSVEPDELYHKEEHAMNSDGKPVEMAVRELRRDVRTSTLAATANRAASAALVGKPLFILNCFYDLAKLRDAEYFIVLSEDIGINAHEAWYLIGFSPDPRVDPKVLFGLEEPFPNGKPEFLSVKAHDEMLRALPTRSLLWFLDLP